MNVILDSGALTALAQGKPSFRAAIDAALGEDIDVLIPTVVLAESTTGRPEDAPINQLLKIIAVVDLDLEIARRAALLRYRTTGASIPDAVVVATADTIAGSTIYTSNAEDLRALAAVRGRSSVVAV